MGKKKATNRNGKVVLKKGLLKKVPHSYSDVVKNDIEKILTNIKLLRVKKEISQEFLTELMDNEVSIEHIRSIESGRVLPSLAILFWMKHVVTSYAGKKKNG